MAHEYRPDLLPYALPTRIGTPLHGLVTNGVLALPGGKTKTYPQPSAGSAWEVANATKAYAPVLTDEQIANDTANGYTWPAYAIINEGGGAKRIGNWPIEAQEWLYCDPAGTVWKMKYSWTVETGANVRIEVRVTGRYGVLSDTRDPVVNRLVGTATHVVTLPSWWLEDYNFRNHDVTAIVIAQAITAAAVDLDHNIDGSAAIWNFHSSAIHETGVAPLFDVYSTLAGWATFTVTGTGSLLEPTFGEGISVTIGTKGLDDVWEEWYSNPDGIDFPYGRGDVNAVVATLDVEYTLPTGALPCPGSGGTPKDFTTETGSVSITGELSPWNGFYQKYKAVLHRYVDGTMIKTWFNFGVQFSRSGSGSGFYSKVERYIWECPTPGPGYWRLDSVVSCTDTTSYRKQGTEKRTWTLGISIGSTSLEAYYDDEAIAIRDGFNLGGCEDFYSEDTDLNVASATNELGEPTAGITNERAVSMTLDSERLNNSCWSVVFTTVVVDDPTGPSPITTYDPHRYILTPTTDTRISDATSTSVYASLQPHTKQLAWSATQPVGYV